MKKALHSIFVFASIAILTLNSFAVDYNSAAQNFTVTDLDGNSHTLYDYLDAGKVVYIYFSATWCPPCWNYHQTGITKNLYNTYGPDGTDEIMVLFIEGDPQTTINNLNGIGSNTQGNWVNGTPFPIADNAATSELYGISTVSGGQLTSYSFPTYIRVYPDRSMEEVNKINDAGTDWATAEELFARHDMDERGVSTSSLDGRIFYHPTMDAIDCDGYVFPKVVVQNYSNTTLNSADVNFIANGEVLETKSISGSLAPYETQEINFSFRQMANDVYRIEYEITSPNGGIDENIDNNKSSQYLNINTGALKPKLSITADDYASELSWKITDWNNVIVASGSDYQDGNTNISKNLCLIDNQCYTLIVEDSYGDGFGNTAGAGGNITLNNGATELMSFASADHTGSSYSQEFCLGSPTGISDEEANVFTVFPNPVNDNATISFGINSTENVSIDMVNILGEKVYTRNLGFLTAGNYNQTLLAYELGSGIYFLNLNIGSETMTKKVIIK